MLRAILAAAVAALAIPMPAGAAVFAGDLDLGLSGDGMLVGAFGPDGDFAAEAVQVLPDGRILAATTTDVLAGAPLNNDFAVGRFLPGGSPDPSFGGGDGVVTVPVAPGNGSDHVSSMALQPDGKILVGGLAAIGDAGGDEFAVVRLDSNGNLDLSFDGETPGSGDGVVRFDVGPSASADWVKAIALLPDGRIVLGGMASLDPTSSGTSSDFAVARLLNDGRFDDSFSGNGTDIRPLVPGTEADTPDALALVPGPSPTAPDIVVVGEGNSPSGGSDFGVIRWHAGGGLDMGFDGDGKLLLPVAANGNDVARGAVASGGRLLVIGQSEVDPSPTGTNYEVSVVALDAAGDLDPSYANGGKLFTGLSPNAGSDVANAVVLDAAGRALLAGGTRDSGGSSDAAVLRLTSSGQLDPSFSGDGWSTLGQPGAQESGLDLALAADGKIVVAGGQLVSGTARHFIARVHGADIPDPPPGGGPGADLIAPVLSGVSLKPSTFRIAKAATPRSAGRKRRPPRGTRIRFTLSEPATVRLTVSGGAPGRRVAGRCRMPSRRNRGRKRCVRRLSFGTLTRSGRPAGMQSLAWSGRIGRKALRPRRYTLSVRATDAAGNRSAARTLRFRIVR